MKSWPTHGRTAPSSVVTPTASSGTNKDLRMSICGLGRSKEATFWDSLTKTERENCIDSGTWRYIGSTKGGGAAKGWNTTGEVQRFWNNPLSRRIQRIQDDLQKKIFRDEWWDIYTTAYMRGISEADAVPTIVVTCWDEGITKRLCREIRRDKLYRISGFWLFGWQGCLVQKAGPSSSAKRDTSSANVDVAGLRVQARLSSGARRVTSIGGVLRIGNELFGLTAAHTFLTEELYQKRQDAVEDQMAQIKARKPDNLSNTKGFEMSFEPGEEDDDEAEDDDDQEDDDDPEDNSDPEDDDNPEDDDDLEDDDDSISETNDLEGDRNTNYELENAHLVLEADKEQSNPRVIGTFQSFPRGELLGTSGVCVAKSFAEADLDWALVALNLQAIHSVNRFMDGGREHKVSNTIGKPVILNHCPFKSDVNVVRNGHSQPMESSGTISIMRAPGAKSSCSVFTLANECEYGDCGTWVLEPISNRVLGVIIGPQPRLNETCVVPIHTILDSIGMVWIDTGVPKIPSDVLKHRADIDPHEQFHDERIHSRQERMMVRTQGQRKGVRETTPASSSRQGSDMRYRSPSPSKTIIAQNQGQSDEDEAVETSIWDTGYTNIRRSDITMEAYKYYALPLEERFGDPDHF